MAIAPLSPWPSTPAALTSATECLKAATGEDDDATAQRLGATAAALVERYAPDAPQPVKNEAVIRFAGYLSQAAPGAVQSETVGPLAVTHVVNHASAFRNSGAAMLLTQWRVRRAGAIG